MRKAGLEADMIGMVLNMRGTMEEMWKLQIINNPEIRRKRREVGQDIEVILEVLPEVGAEVMIVLLRKKRRTNIGLAPAVLEAEVKIGSIKLGIHLADLAVLLTANQSREKKKVMQ